MKTITRLAATLGLAGILLAGCGKTESNSQSNGRNAGVSSGASQSSSENKTEQQKTKDELYKMQFNNALDLYATKRYNEAIDAAEKTIKIEPDNAENKRLYFVLAYSYKNLGDARRANEFSRKAGGGDMVPVDSKTKERKEKFSDMDILSLHNRLYEGDLAKNVLWADLDGDGIDEAIVHTWGEIPSRGTVHAFAIYSQKGDKPAFLVNSGMCTEVGKWDFSDYYKNGKKDLVIECVEWPGGSRTPMNKVLGFKNGIMGICNFVREEPDN